MFHALGSVEISAMPYVATLLIALAFCVLTFAGAALLDSDRDNALVRLGQRLRLRSTRMHRMLQRRGIQAGPYVRTLGVVQVRSQIATCRACGSQQLCDRALASRGGANSHSRFTFCPNRPALERYLDPRAQIGGACFSR